MRWTRCHSSSMQGPVPLGLRVHSVVEKADAAARGEGVRVQRALHRDLEVVRGDLAGAVVELYAPPQVEGVDRTVVADVPFLGDVGDQLEVPVERDETGEYLHDVFGGAGVRGAGGVAGGGGWAGGAGAASPRA